MSDVLDETKEYFAFEADREGKSLEQFAFEYIENIVQVYQDSCDMSTLNRSSSDYALAILADKIK